MFGTSDAAEGGGGDALSSSVGSSDSSEFGFGTGGTDGTQRVGSRRTGPDDSDGDTHKQQFVLNKAFALVLFVVLYMVLFGATVFVLRTLWRHGLCGTGSGSGLGFGFGGARDSEAPEKVRKPVLLP